MGNKLLSAFDPATFATLTFKHADGCPSLGVEHLANQVRLSATPASKVFASFRAGKCIAAEMIHGSPASLLSAEVNIGS